MADVTKLISELQENGQNMTAIKHILIPVDGSDTSTKSADYGGDLARALGARVTALVVLDDQVVVPATWHAAGMFGPGATSSASTESVREEFEKIAVDVDLPKAAAAIGELPSPAKLVYEWGHVPSKICEYAAENGVDLIVIGSHGRTGLKAALLGSVSHAVTNRAPCAVTVVR